MSEALHPMRDNAQFASNFGRVELGVRLGHASSTVVLIHLGEGVAVGVELGRCLVPPHREVFLESTAHVGTVRSRLRNDLMEGLVRALPNVPTDREERGEGECGWQTKDEVLGLGAQDWAHQGVGEHPSGRKIENTL